MREVARKGETQGNIERVHCGFGGAHMSKNYTVDAVVNKYFLSGLSKDVKQFFRSCVPCQKNRVPKIHGPELSPIHVSIRIFDRWGIDLVGPFKESRNGNKFIRVAVEYTSRWPEAMAIPTEHVRHVSKFFFDLICGFGVMWIMLSDNRREVCNSIVDDMEK